MTENAATDVATEMAHKTDDRIGSMEMTMLALKQAVSPDPKRAADNDRVLHSFAGNLPPVCRNLAMGSNETKMGSTRGLGEGCPKPTGAK